MKHWQRQYEDKSRPPASKPQLLSISEQRLSTILFEDKAWFHRGYKIKNAPLNCNQGLHPWLWASAAPAVSAAPSEQTSISYESYNPENLQNQKARADSNVDSLFSIDDTGVSHSVEASYLAEPVLLKVQGDATVPITHCANDRYSGESPAGPSGTNLRQRPFNNLAEACISITSGETHSSSESQFRKGFYSRPNKTSTCIDSSRHQDNNPSDISSLRPGDESEHTTDDEFNNDDTAQLQSFFQRQPFIGYALSVIGEIEEPPTDETPHRSLQHEECSSLQPSETFASQNHVLLPEETQDKRHDETLGTISLSKPAALVSGPKAKWKTIPGSELLPLYHAQNPKECYIKLGVSSQLDSVEDEGEKLKFAEELKCSIEAEYALHTIFEGNAATRTEQPEGFQSTSDVTGNVENETEQKDNQCSSKESMCFNEVGHASHVASHMDAEGGELRGDNISLAPNQRCNTNGKDTHAGTKKISSFQTRIATWANAWSGVHKVDSWHCSIEESGKMAATLKPGSELHLKGPVEAQGALQPQKPYRATPQLRNDHSLQYRMTGEAASSSTEQHHRQFARDSDDTASPPSHRGYSSFTGGRDYAPELYTAPLPVTPKEHRSGSSLRTTIAAMGNTSYGATTRTPTETLPEHPNIGTGRRRLRIRKIPVKARASTVFVHPSDEGDSLTHNHKHSAGLDYSIPGSCKSGSTGGHRSI